MPSFSTWTYSSSKVVGGLEKNRPNFKYVYVCVYIIYIIVLYIIYNTYCIFYYLYIKILYVHFLKMLMSMREPLYDLENIVSLHIHHGGVRRCK